MQTMSMAHFFGAAGYVGLAIAALCVVVCAFLVVEGTRLREQNTALQTQLAQSRTAPVELIAAPAHAAIPAETAQARFLATISHEMRTPLNGVLGMTSLLRDTGLSQEQASYVDAVRTSGEALLSLINEILDFSRLEAGKFDTVEETVELKPLIEGIVELLAPRVQDKGIEIASMVHPDVAKKVVTDGARLRQVLLNLAGNAVKFTETGGVAIRVEPGPAEMITFCVADTGIGIAPDRMDAIFSEFEQEAADTAKKFGGTGLGLSISRRIVEFMGGNITVMSRVGAGSVFRFALPLQAVTEEAPPAQHKPLAQDVFILSRSPFEAPFMAERLERLGARVRIFAEPAKVMAAMTPGGLLLVDAAYGAEECRVVAKAAEQVGMARRMILLSPYERRGFGSPREMGFDGYLIKPVREASLLAQIRESQPAGNGAVQSVAGISALPELLRGQQVLIAEDNPINALLVTRLVEKCGGVAVWAKDGEEALEKFAEAPAGHFVMALFDVRMPRRDGLSAVAILREQEKAHGLARLPVIALTANAYEADRQQCLAAGFDDFLPKPLDRDAFTAMLTKFVGTEKIAA